LKGGIRYLFVIDSSGSHAAQQKMRIVKGAVLSLLDRSFRKGDEVVVITFRGINARLLLEPSRRLEDVATALEYLPTGGRTPLASALEMARTYLTPSTVLILLSDGRANVAMSDGDPWREALGVAAQTRTKALVVDTEDGTQPIERCRELADALKAQYVRLEELDTLEILPLEH